MYLYKSLFPLINVQIIGLGPTKIQCHLLFIRLDLQRSNFQIRSMSEVAAVGILIAPPTKHARRKNLGEKGRFVCLL